jgi:hypothetical protein
MSITSLKTVLEFLTLLFAGLAALRKAVTRWARATARARARQRRPARVPRAQPWLRRRRRGAAFIVEAPPLWGASNDVLLRPVLQPQPAPRPSSAFMTRPVRTEQLTRR